MAVSLGEGAICPKCNTVMKRKGHGESFKKPYANCYYEYWDRCPFCGHKEVYLDALRAPVGTGPKAEKMKGWVEKQKQSGIAPWERVKYQRATISKRALRKIEIENRRDALAKLKKIKEGLDNDDPPS